MSKLVLSVFAASTVTTHAADIDLQWYGYSGGCQFCSEAANVVGGALAADDINEMVMIIATLECELTHAHIFRIIRSTLRIYLLHTGTPPTKATLALQKMTRVLSMILIAKAPTGRLAS